MMDTSNETTKLSRLIRHQSVEHDFILSMREKSNVFKEAVAEAKSEWKRGKCQKTCCEIEKR